MKTMVNPGTKFLVPDSAGAGVGRMHDGEGREHVVVALGVWAEPDEEPLMFAIDVVLARHLARSLLRAADAVADAVERGGAH